MNQQEPRQQDKAVKRRAGKYFLAGGLAARRRGRYCAGW